jgi:hypothetical protein
LVEALLAAVLIVVGIAGLLGAISAGLRAKVAGEFYSTAALLAQQRLAEMEAAPSLSLGEERGDFSPEHPHYQWTALVEEGPTGLLLVRLRINEATNGQPGRNAELATYLLRREQ